MKINFTALFFFLVLTIGYAQQSINYKAIVKDNNGNVVSNEIVIVQFSILKGIAQTNVYQETHAVNTDQNGLLNLKIGNGTVDSGSYAINWADDEHFLNVQINTGNGLVDMGTTIFTAVPYALSALKSVEADNVTGLEALDESNGVGWRLLGRNGDNYGNIGLNAVDLSYSDINSDTYGATGTNSVVLGDRTIASGATSTAMGFRSIASGIYSTALGENAIASGNNSTAMGHDATASGYTSTSIGVNTSAIGSHSLAMGYLTSASGSYSIAIGGLGTKAESYNSFALGRYNLGGGNSTSWIDTDPLFEIGNGVHSSNRNNAFTVLKNGNIAIGGSTPHVKLQIVGGTDAQVSNNQSGYLVTGSVNGANIVIDNNEIMARNNGSTSELYLQHSGGSVYVGGALVHSSDRRLKEEIIDLSYGLKEIIQLQPKAYYWKNREQTSKSFGLIAQDVQPIIKNIVFEREDEDKMLSVNYTELIPVLINAIKEQQDIINSQNKSINKLEQRVDALEVKKSK